MNFFDSITGPLDKNACVLYYAWTMFFFILLIIAFVTHMYLLFKNSKIIDMNHIISIVIMLFNIFLAYFSNRLLYTICNKSLS
jgi:hypothetical protein